MCARNAAQSAPIDIVLSSTSTESGLPLSTQRRSLRKREALCMIDASAQFPHIGARRFFGEGGDRHFRRQISVGRRRRGQSVVWRETPPSARTRRHIKGMSKRERGGIKAPDWKRAASDTSRPMQAGRTADRPGRLRHGDTLPCVTATSTAPCRRRCRCEVFTILCSLSPVATGCPCSQYWSSDFCRPCFYLPGSVLAAWTQLPPK